MKKYEFDGNVILYIIPYLDIIYIQRIVTPNTYMLSTN